MGQNHIEVLPGGVRPVLNYHEAERQHGLGFAALCPPMI